MSNTNSNNQTVGINIQLGVNGAASVSQATQSVQTLNQTISRTGQSNIARPVATLRQELRNATNEASRLAAAGQQNTQAYVDAARRVTDLRNQIDEMNNSLRSFDPDNKFRVAANGAAAATRAIGGYTGALTLLGIESEDAAQTLAKLQAISSLADGIDGVLDLQDSFKDLLRMLGLNLTATNAQTSATAANTVTNTANAASTTAVATANNAAATAQSANAAAAGAASTATNAATVSTTAFGVALKAIGIGLIVAAIVALWSNFDIVKKKIDELFPGLGGIDNLFDKIVQTVYGLGAAVKKTFSGLGKALTDLLTGNFSKIGDDLKEAFDVSDAFRKGVADKVAADADEAKRERIAKEIEANERIIKERKALGQDTYNLEVANQRKKIQVLDKEDKDYQKNKANAESELTILINTENKKRSDKALEISKAQAEKEKQQREKDLADIKKNNEDALKIIAESSKSGRDLELANLQIKYKAEFDLLEKRKKNLKDYNAQFNNLTEARKLEEKEINKKYDDDINAYLKSLQGDTISSYQKTIDEINATVDSKLKTASPEQAQKLNSARTEQVNRLNNLSTLDDASQQANTNLTVTEDENRPNENDSPEQAASKVEAVNAAKLDAENKAFALKQQQLAGQNNALAQLEADHQKNINDINLEASEARKAIDDAEREAKLDNLQTVSGAINGLSQLANENSAAGKILGIAQATIDTYVGANKAIAQGGLFGWAAAAGIIASGLANVKKIVSVKIPNAVSTVPGSTGSGNIPSAPVINTTMLNQANSGSQDVVNAVQSKNNDPVKVYITEKDLLKNSKKVEIEDKLSSY